MFEYINGRLESLKEEKYAAFHSSLIPGADQRIIGVRLPKLRELAKEIAKEKPEIFLAEAKAYGNIYEWSMLSALVTATAKWDFNTRLAYLKDFMPRINNWAVCDSLCNSLKDFKKHQREGFDFLMTYAHSPGEYEKRFVLVMLMCYYLNEEYIDRVIDYYINVETHDYYVSMAVAWSLATCYVTYPKRVEEILENHSLDKTTHNRTIQKIRESYRVAKEDKDRLNLLKIK